MNVKEKINNLSKKYSEDIVSLRRTIHRNPELSFKEFETSKLVFDKLTKIKLDSVKKIASTGVTGLIKGSSKGKCVGLRADLDALPILEKTGLPFASKNNGVMHACGHDAHTSMLYGAALILN